MKLKLDLHEIYSNKNELESALIKVMDEAQRKKIKLIEIIPGKGTQVLKKYVLRFLEKRSKGFRPAVMPLFLSNYFPLTLACLLDYS